MSKKYLYRISILSKKNSNPLESIAHYCGEDQYDSIEHKQYISSTEKQVVWSNLIVPDKKEQLSFFQHLPDYLKFRSQKPDLISNSRNILWKNVDSRETRPDSQFARLFELAIPHFLTQEESILLLTQFTKNLITEGMIIDCALHSHNKKAPILSILEKFKIINSPEKEPENNNQDYTGFLICTLRDYKNGQFVNKNRDWNNKEKLKEWRFSWTNLLESAIKNNDNVTETEKNNWIKKLSIYPGYSDCSETVAKLQKVLKI